MGPCLFLFEFSDVFSDGGPRSITSVTLVVHGASKLAVFSNIQRARCDHFGNFGGKRRFEVIGVLEGSMGLGSVDPGLLPRCCSTLSVWGLWCRCWGWGFGVLGLINSMITLRSYRRSFRCPRLQWSLTSPGFRVAVRLMWIMFFRWSVT